MKPEPSICGLWILWWLWPLWRAGGCVCVHTGLVWHVGGIMVSQAFSVSSMSRWEVPVEVIYQKLFCTHDYGDEADPYIFIRQCPD